MHFYFFNIYLDNAFANADFHLINKLFMIYDLL